MLMVQEDRISFFFFSRQKEDGWLENPAPSFALAAIHNKMSFFLWKVPCSFLRPYTNCVFPALHNSFPQWWYVQRHRTSAPLVLGPSFAFLSALSFWGWHELKDYRSLDPFWCLCRMICLSEIPLLRPNPAFRCACVFPLISVRLTAFWGPCLAFNLLCLKD